MKRKRWRVAGINFDHFHMGDLLRFAREHPQAEIVGISDEQPARMEEAIRKLGIPRDTLFPTTVPAWQKRNPRLFSFARPQLGTESGSGRLRRSRFISWWKNRLPAP